MKIFVISLKSALQRRRVAAGKLRVSGLPFEFFDGIDGSCVQEDALPALAPWRFRLNTRRYPLPGEIGCFASHRALWKKCVESARPIIVLEDDFELEQDFPQVVQEISESIETFGYIRLESSGRRKSLLKKLRPGVFDVQACCDQRLKYLSDPPLCMLAYAISPKAAAALLAASKTMTAPVDKFLQQTWRHKVPVFGLEPGIARLAEQSGPSTIGVRSGKSRNPILLLCRMLYKGFGEFRRIEFDAKQCCTHGARAVRHFVHQKIVG